MATMVCVSISLEYAELQAAAQAVAAGVTPLQDILTELSGSLEASSTGFKGQAAGGLGEALTAWFQVATTLGPVLEGYAGALMAVANEHAVNDAARTSDFGHLTERLGGGS